MYQSYIVLLRAYCVNIYTVVLLHGTKLAFVQKTVRLETSCEGISLLSIQVNVLPDRVPGFLS